MWRLAGGCSCTETQEKGAKFSSCILNPHRDSRPDERRDNAAVAVKGAERTKRD